MAANYIDDSDYRNSNSILYIIPQEEETRNDLLNIDKNTKEDVRRTYRVNVARNWECNTITGSVIENIIRTMSKELKETRNNNLVFNFNNLIEAYITVKHDKDAEKEGNINIAFRPGPRVNAIISDDTPREDREYEYISTEAKFGANPESTITKRMLMLDAVSRKELGGKYGIIIKDPWVAIAIADSFVENLFRELIMKIVLTKKPSASINFNDNIEIHTVSNQGGLSITMRPGMNAKLLIKSDEITEADNDDDDGDL